jgi:PKD repeat protein
MKMYRNYDGNKSAFGNTSVQASVPNPDNLAAFAAQRSSDGALTVMVISKVLSGSTPITVSLANFSGNGTAQAWQLTSANAITRLSDLSYSAGSLSATVPPQSITLFVLPTGAPNTPPTASLSATPTSGIAPLAVTLDASASIDTDGTITNYAWVFGDGATSSGPSPSVSHTYATAGTYTAKVTVTDNGGATASATATITSTADPNAIAAPSSLTGTGTKGGVSLTWRDNSNNETGFHIERAPNGSSSFTMVGTVAANATSYSESVPRGNYNYRVQAFNQSTGKVSNYSNTVNVRSK